MNVHKLLAIAGVILVPNLRFSASLSLLVRYYLMKKHSNYELFYAHSLANESNNGTLSSPTSSHTSSYFVSINNSNDSFTNAGGRNARLLIFLIRILNKVFLLL